MNSITQFQLLLLASSAILLGIHMLMSRIMIFIRLNRSPQVVAFLAIFFGYPVIGLLSWKVYLEHLTGTDLNAAIIYAFIVYTAFAYSYFHFFNMSETARRIKILSCLFLSGPTSIAVLKEKYTLDQQIENRLERLLALRQVKKIGGRYVIRNRFLWRIALIVMKFREILKLDQEQIGTAPVKAEVSINDLKDL